LDLEAAAGVGVFRNAPEALGDAENWVTWDAAPAFKRGDFLAKVVGKSMEPLIPSGSWCLFRPTTIEAAEGRVVLAQIPDDASDGLRFLVKELRVTWAENPRMRRTRSSIELRSRNPAYATHRFDEASVQAVAIVAELIDVVGT
jgi:phage repressor protein C with HTH and peptisase S24 domain